jgi:hypothetical protein
MTNRWLAVAFPAVLLIASGCTSAKAEAPEGRAAGAHAFQSAVLATLDDAELPVLAVPGGISIRADGSLLVPDFSDKNIKLYDASGRRSGAVGRPGPGPGEFASLFGAQPYGDSIIGYDIGRGITVFSPDGRFGRLLKVRSGIPREVMSVRVLDDSLFLLIGSPMGGQGDRDLLAIVRPDGRRVSTFFNMAKHFAANPEVEPFIFVEADGRDGVVFAGLVGGDSVWAFDYYGRRLGAAPVDPQQPLRTTAELIAANRGKPQRGDGTWAFQGNRQLFRVVAVDQATAFLYVAAYDPAQGIDLAEGGTVLAVSVNGGTVNHLARGELEAGLYGRDRQGNALLMGYADAQQEHYTVSRLSLVPSTGR